QSDYVVSKPASKGYPVGLRGRLQPHCFQLCQHEPVNVVSWPVGGLHSRNNRSRKWLVRPEGTPGLDGHPYPLEARLRSLPRVGSTQLDPFLEIGDHDLRQLPFGGHSDVTVVVQYLDKQAVGGFVGNDYRTTVAALAYAFARVQMQPSLQFLGLL